VPCGGVLVRVGLVSHRQLKKCPYVIVGAFVVGAIFTPPDVISQVMLPCRCGFSTSSASWCARVVGRSRLRQRHPRRNLDKTQAQERDRVLTRLTVGDVCCVGRLPTATCRSTSLLSRRSRTEAGFPDECRHQVQHRVRSLTACPRSRSGHRGFSPARSAARLEARPRSVPRSVPSGRLSHFRSDLPRFDADPTARGRRRSG